MLRTPREVVRNGLRKVIVPIIMPDLLSMLPPLPLLPVTTDILDLPLIVQRGVIVVVHTTKPLPDGETLAVNRDAGVLLLPRSADVYPPALLLLEIQLGRIGEEEPGEERTGEPEPREDAGCRWS